jgi:hypothetical protein
MVLAGVGAVGLAVAAAFHWFALGKPDPCGWTCYSVNPDGTTVSWPDSRVHPQSAYEAIGAVGIVALAVIALGGVVAAASRLRRVVDRPRTLLAATALAGLAASAVLLVRTLWAQPGLGFGEPNELVALRPAAWIGLAFAVLTTTGLALLWAEARRTAARRA